MSVQLTRPLVERVGGLPIGNLFRQLSEMRGLLSESGWIGVCHDAATAGGRVAV